MMKKLLPLLFLMVMPALGQDIAPILKPIAAPTGITVSHPASFYRVDSDVFAAAQSLADDALVELTLSLPKIGEVELVLARYRVFEPTSRIAAMTKNGIQSVAPPQSVLLRGKVRNVEGGFVVLALYPEWGTGMITVPTPQGTLTFRVSPLATPRKADEGALIIYHDADVPDDGGGWTCGTAEPKGFRIPTPKAEERSQAVQFRKITIAIECDDAYYADHGNNITKATQYAEAVVAASSAIYERDVEATLSIGSLLVWTTADPYTGTASDAMLVQFRDRWRNLHGSVNRTLAHLLSGVNNIGGIAYLDQLCNKQWGYAVSGTNNNINYPAAGYVWDTDVFSHELGHNIGSPHTHSCTWAPPIDSCYTAEGGCFTGTRARKGTIMSYCHLTSQGTDLQFHSKVVTLMKGKLSNGACTPLISMFDVDVPATLEACSDQPVTITATVTGNTGKVSYRWQGGGIDTVTTTNVYTLIPTATFTLRCTATDSLAVVVADSTRITVNARPSASLDVQTNRVCKGTTVEHLSVVTGGRPPYSYRWFTNGKLVDTVNDKLWPVIDSTTLVRLIVTDQGGCADTAQITIYVPDKRLVLTPARLEFSSLPPCKDRIETQVALRNAGLEDIIIDSIRTRRGTMLAVRAPIVIPTSEIATIDLTVTPSAQGSVLDTIVFFVQECGIQYRMPLSFSRTSVALTSAAPVDFGTKLLCKDTLMYTTSLELENRSDVAIVVDGVRGRTMGANVVLVDGPVSIAPRNKGTVTVSAPGRKIGGEERDSLTILYSTEECTGQVTVASVIRTIGINIDHPTTVSFDTVRSGEPARTKAFNINVTLIGSPKVSVSDVVVDGPFTTTIEKGTVFSTGKPYIANVTFAPGEIPSDGEVQGAIRFTLDACPTERVVLVNAILKTVTVGVEDYTEEDMKDWMAHVYDVRGSLLFTAENQDAFVRWMDTLQYGVYAVVRRSPDGRNTVRMITSR